MNCHNTQKPCTQVALPDQISATDTHRSLKFTLLQFVTDRKDSPTCPYGIVTNAAFHTTRADSEPRITSQTCELVLWRKEGIAHLCQVSAQRNYAPFALSLPENVSPVSSHY